MVWSVNPKQHKWSNFVMLNKIIKRDTNSVDK
nr:MAG TPA: hypothetical protein [Caudoviricetes sp.]